MIVHASISENNNAGWDGKSKSGDQTGKEVYARSFYKKPWGVMLRYKDSKIALKASRIAKKLADSNLVGYDQSERNTLYKTLKKYDWNVDKYIASGEKTETDCSAFVYACYCCLVPGMRSDSNAPRTATMRSFFSKYGFTVYTASKWLDSDHYLIPGDVLIKEGSHTVMNISTGSKVKETTSESKTDSNTSGKLNRSPKWVGKVTASALNVRSWAGTEHDNIKSYPVLYKGNLVDVCDTVKVKDGGSWYYVRIAGKIYGFVSAKYIARA